MGPRVNLLLDTHVLLWWFTSDARLSSAAEEALVETSNIAYVSAAVAWELAIRTTSGKLEAHAILADFHELLLHRSFRRLAISTAHALRAGQLPLHHRDPFDRMLVAQAHALNFAPTRSLTATALSAFGEQLLRQCPQRRPEDRVEVLPSRRRYRPFHRFLCNCPLVAQVGEC